ncbi:TRAP transporter substrate-binding protein [Prosthecomicrobium sp. N25]|uniref:TRAP transporter substrate-binding protein n=1 Tax=Prosthecomicrobium sp. N25 TaxID=3129254 RepID=UPI003077EA7C
MTLSLTRRTLLAGSGAVLATPAIVRSAFAAVSLTLGHGAAPGNPRTVAAEAFAKAVADKTAGRITVKIAGSEQLGNDSAMLTLLRTGALDLTANSQGATSAVLPELAALGLPFLFKDNVAANKVMQGDIGAELEKRLDAVGIVPLDWWDNGIRHITNSKRAINVPDDLKGLKMRTPADPMTVDIFTALGASTAQIAFGELYVALQQGVVDGQENPLANISSAKLHEVNKFITLSGHKWESTPFLMSKISVGKVGADLAVVKAAAKEAGVLQRQLMLESDVKLLEAYKANPAVAVNQADLASFRKATEGVVESWKKKPFGDFVGRIASAAA